MSCRLRVYLFYVALIAHSNAFGNDEMDIKYGQGTPYRVVYANDNGNSQKPVGIYKRNAENGWVSVLNGSILVDPQVGPIWQNLDLSKYSNLYEALTIKDGRVVILNVEAQQSDLRSYINLGDDQNKILEPLSGRRVTLNNPITSTKDVNIYHQEVSLGDTKGELVVISLAGVNDLLGTGLTFAVIIHSTEDKRIGLWSEPFIVDYTFRDLKTLKSLIVAKDSNAVGIKSINLVASLARTQMSNHIALRQWADSLQGAEDRLLSEDKVYFNLRGEIVFPDELKQIVYEQNGTTITEIYSSKNVPIVKISNSYGILEIPGKIDRDKNGQLLMVEAKKGDLLISINGKIYLSTVDKSSQQFRNIIPGVIDLEKVIPIPNLTGFSNDISFYFHYRGEFILLYSNAQGTRAIKIIKNQDDFKFEEFSINKQFYTSDDLSRRVSVSNDELHFDFITPPSSTDEEYKALKQEDTPLLNVNKSSESARYAAFTNMKHATTLRYLRSVSYQEYDDVDNPKYNLKRTTGLKVGDVFINGELISSKTDRVEYIWSSNALFMKFTDHLNFSVLMIDRNYSGGAAAEPFIILSNRDEKVLAVEPLFPQSISLKANKDFFIEVIPSSGVNNNFGILYGYSDSKGAQVKIKTFSIDTDKLTASKDSDKKSLDDYKGFITLASEIDLEKANDVYGSNLNKRTYLARLFYTQNADIYYSLTPELEFNDNQFAAIRLYDKKTIPGFDLRSDTLKFIYSGSELLDGSDTQHKSANWRVLSNYRSTSKTLNQMPFSFSSTQEVQNSLFPDLAEQLNELAKGTKEHMAFVVPDAFKEEVQTIILSQWAANRSKTGFSIQNPNLAFYIFEDNTQVNSQSALIEHIQSIPENASDKTPLLFIDGAKVLASNRRINNSRMETFVVDPSNYSLATKTFETTDDNGAYNAEKDNDKEKSHPEVPPHTIAWLATEGKPVDYRTVKDINQKSIGMVLIISESELESLKSAAALEDSFNVFDQFNMVHLEAPDVDAQRRWVENVLKDRVLVEMNYTYSADNLHRLGKNLSSEEARSYIINRIVNEVNKYSAKENKSKLVSLKNVLEQMREFLIHDPKTRERRVIDAAVIMQVLAKEFHIKLDPAYMPPYDRLALLSRDDFPRLVFEKTGYNNFNDVANFKNLILQFATGESKLAVGASFLLGGEPGAGKTQLVQAVLKTLDLKIYNYRLPLGAKENEDADVFFVVGADLVDNQAAGFVSPKVIDEHYEYFLTRPQAYRSFTLVDDVHIIPDKIRAVWVQRFRSIIDMKKDDKLTAETSIDGKKFKVQYYPSNMVMGLIVNYTDNAKEIEDAKKIKDAPPTINDLIVASIKEPDVPFDHSFLDRIGAIWSIGNPSWSKETNLITSMSESNRNLLSSGKFHLVTLGAITNIVDAVKDNLSGRGFEQKIPNAVSAQFARTNSAEHGVYIMIPDKSSYSSKDDINQIVEAKTAVVPLATSTEGQLYFMDSLIDSFRARLMESFADTMERTEEFSGTVTKQHLFLSWAQQAIYNHLKEKPRIPLTAIAIDPKKMGVNDLFSQQELIQQIKSVSDPEKTDFFPKIFERRRYKDKVLAMTDEFVNTANATSRGNINLDFANKIMKVLEEALADQVKPESDNASAADWAKSLDRYTKEDMAKKRAATGAKLVELFKEYKKAITSDDVMKFHIEQTGNVDVLSFYDLSRTFLFVLDRAIARLDWASVTYMLTQNLEHITEDISISDKPGVQRFLFEDKASLLRPVSQAHLGQVLDQSKARKTLEAENVEAAQKGYMAKCVNMTLNKLAAPDSGTKEPVQ